MCIEWRPCNNVLSTIDAEEHWRATKRQTIQSATVSHCGKAPPCKGKKSTFTRYYSLGSQNDRNPNAPTRRGKFARTGHVTRDFLLQARWEETPKPPRLETCWQSSSSTPKEFFSGTTAGSLYASTDQRSHHGLSRGVQCGDKRQTPNSGCPHR